MVIPPSVETYKQAIIRALEAGLTSSLVVFAFMPINLDDPMKFLKALGIGMIAGFLVGIQKFIRGYFKYDNPPS